MVAGEYVRVAARAGEVALMIGEARGGSSSGVAKGKGKAIEEYREDEGGAGLDAETSTLGRAAAAECWGMGGTLEAVGKVIEACLSDEILKSKCVPLCSFILNNGC